MRPPTSHEQRAGRPWNASYQDAGPAPWDIGRPQPALMELPFTGAVLDVGCGTGENALHIAAQGLRVLGIDVAETAIALARTKAADRGIDAEFMVADAFELKGRFDTVLDCGLFHTFDAEERPRYVASLASVIAPGGTLYVLCFRPGPDTGPHPVSRDALTEAFSAWDVVAIEPDRLQTRFSADGAPAWLATMKRI